MADKKLKEQKDAISGLVKSTENQVEKLTNLLNTVDKDSWYFRDITECLERTSKNLMAFKDMENCLGWDIKDNER